MAPKYKLIYFTSASAAEPIRYIFAYANQEFEDFRIKPEDWPQIKKTTPFGRVPVLEIDGKQVPQSNAIGRYLARKFGLTGKNDWEALQCDVIIDTIGDVRQSTGRLFFEKDDVKKEILKQELLQGDVPFYLGKFEKIVGDNGGFTVGSQVTWSDLSLAANMEGLEGYFGPKLLDSYPTLKALQVKINSLPNIKAYLDRRPTYPAQ